MYCFHFVYDCALFVWRSLWFLTVIQTKPPLFFSVAATCFSSGTEEETSGYESEGGRSLSPSASLNSISPSPSSPPSGRRPRTAFTTEQIRSLERAFKRNAYLGTQDKAELCKKLNLSDKQVGITWPPFEIQPSITVFWFVVDDMRLMQTQKACILQIARHVSKHRGIRNAIKSYEILDVNQFITSLNVL